MNQDSNDTKDGKVSSGLCKICNNTHRLNKCWHYLNKSSMEQLPSVHSNKLCTNYLKDGRESELCPSKLSCLVSNCSKHYIARCTWWLDRIGKWWLTLKWNLTRSMGRSMFGSWRIIMYNTTRVHGNVNRAGLIENSINGSTIVFSINYQFMWWWLSYIVAPCKLSNSLHIV